MMPPGFCCFNFIKIRAFEKPLMNSSEDLSIKKENADSTSESSSMFPILCKTLSLRRKVHFCTDPLVFCIHSIALLPISYETYSKIIVK